MGCLGAGSSGGPSLKWEVGMAILALEGLGSPLGWRLRATREPYKVPTESPNPKP